MTARARVREWMPPALVSAVTLVVGLVLVARDPLPVGGFYDDGMYVVLAKSIATGHGFHWLNVPGAPAATHFPPGYPAVLALLWMLYPRFPANVLLFRAMSVVFLAIAAFGLVVFARRRLGLSSAGAAALVLAGVLGLPALMLGTQVMSEPLFLALLLPALLLAENVVDGEDRAARLVGLGVLVGLLTLVRTNGIALVAAVGCVLLLRRRVRAAIQFGVATFVVLLPWQVWVHAHGAAVPHAMGGSYLPYAAWLAEGFQQSGIGLLPRTVVRNSAGIGNMLALFAAPSMAHGIQMLAAALVVIASLAGLRRLWRTAPVTAVFLVSYMGLVLVWPFRPTRFLWGIWPLFVVLPVLGVLETAAWRAGPRAMRAARYAALACSVLIVMGYARYTRRAYAGRWWASIGINNARAVRPLIQWVRANTAPEAVVASSADAMIYLYGNRLTVPVSRFVVRDYFRPQTSAERAAALRGILDVFRVDAVAVVGQDSLRSALGQMAGARPPEMVLLDSLPNGFVYSPVSR